MKEFPISSLYRQWSSWRRQSINRNILVAILTVGPLTFGTAIAYMARWMLVAAFFGIGDAIDAFILAFLPVSFVITVVVGAFTSSFIPTYVEIREQQGVKAAQEFFAQSMIVSFTFLGVVVAVLALLAPYFLPFLSLGFDAEKLALTQRLFYCLLPVVLIKGITTLWSAILNADERFALAALSHLAMPLSSIIFLLVWGSDYGIYTLVAGTVIGFLLELPLLCWGLKRYRIALLPRWHGNNSAQRQVVAQYLPLVTAAAFMGGTTFVDTTMAAALHPGSVAALDYGNKVVVGITNMSTLVLGTAVLPFFSQLTSVDDWTTLRRLLKKYSLLILLVTVPITLLIVVVSEPLVSLLFQRGEFGEMDTQLVGRIQAVYGLQLPFYVVGILFVRLISAGKANSILMVGSFLNLLLNVVLNYIFMQYWGVVGIALATVCVYIFSCIFLLIMSYKRLLRWRENNEINT